MTAVDKRDSRIHILSVAGWGNAARSGDDSESVPMSSSGSVDGGGMLTVVFVYALGDDAA